MPGVTGLEKTLIGVEASAGGDTDAPTTHWRGTGKIRDRREQVRPVERVGKLGGTTRKYTSKTGSEVPLEGDATFEQLPYILNAAIYNAAPTSDTGSGWIREWDVQNSSSDPLATTDLATLVVESGDNNAMERARFCFVREFTLSGAQGETMMLASMLQARSPTTDTAFSAVGDTDLENEIESILFSMVKMYIDDSTGTIGSTQKTETILNFSHKHTTGWVELPARDGRLDFANIKHIDDEILTDVRFEHNGVAVAEKKAWRDEKERAIRIEFIGSALTEAGAYSTKLLRIDMYGTWDSFGAEGLDEEDGDNVYSGTFRSSWSAASGKKCVYTIVNEIETLP